MSDERKPSFFGAQPVPVTSPEAQMQADLVQTLADLTEACTLLRRAAMVVTTYESGAAALEHAHDDSLLLPDIGAFLARVAPP